MTKKSREWREDGWVVLDALVGADEIDGAMDDLHLMFPPAEKYFADPDKYIPPGKTTAELRTRVSGVSGDRPGLASRAAPVGP